MNEEFNEDETKREMPEKFRASIDETDADAFARLQANDAKQKELREKINVPFASHSPQDREFVNAGITIETLENAAESQKLIDSQIEQLAESYAAVGEYHKAADLTLSDAHAEIYEKYWEAIWNDADADGCGHGDNHLYVKDNVYSVRESRFVPLLACNICGMWTVTDAPDHLIAAQKRRAQVRAAVSGKTPEQVKQYLNQNFRGNL